MELAERYIAATSLTQALAALALPGGAVVLAGGTDLMPQSNAGKVKPAGALLNIRRVPGLDEVALADGGLCIGALVTVSTLLRDPLVRRHAPLLAQAADHFASEQVRNAATIGGNLCNASPAGDLLTPLLALDAEVELASLAGDGSVASRRVLVDGFFSGPGRTQRRAAELLVAVRVPAATPSQVARFYKAGTRPALDISPISIAFAAQRDGAVWRGVRLALGAVAPTPIRARSAERVLEGQAPDAARIALAAETASTDARPIDDVRASAWYRRELVRNMTQRMLGDVA
jgi:xanthine dehydrogenase FAD-binding subunit